MERDLAARNGKHEAHRMKDATQLFGETSAIPESSTFSKCADCDNFHIRLTDSRFESISEIS
eukprot:6189622-Pleurochrysis_carterae.AAC.3